MDDNVTIGPRDFKLTLRIVTLLVLVLASSCEDGTLQVDYGSDLDPETFGPPSSQTGSNGSWQPPGTVGTTDPGTAQTDPNAPPPLLNFATFGSRCLDGQSLPYLVLSDAASDCASDARRLDGQATSGGLQGAVALQLDGSTQFQTSYCPTGGACETVTLDVTLDPTSGVGSWTGTVGGQMRTVPFSAQSCAYDAVVDPLPGDSPARGVSIQDVAVYQGVKVPVIANGQLVTDPNAPIVAGRPGIVRVFVTPEADWQARDIIVRLTIGDVVKEQTFRPTAASMETSGDSTANFELAPGELAADADFSVELVEAQACASAPGAVARPRVPDVGTAPLGAQGLAANMRVMLVPIQYDADGSGRVPNLDAAAVERYRQEAFKNYPVPDVDITLHQPVAYQGGLSANGTGFGEALNFCLTVRANDNPDPEVYYFCVLQPAATFQQFCGGGCVAGVAPVPGANDVGSRGGIGISFNGDGEGVFVHEIGHTLGRPHSPCGGAAGTDPNYPYAQGIIGSWGYDIMNGQLFQPDQRADFMGYCEPTWVSDYTYGLIFDRLRSVIGAQQFLVATPPTRWRTAVLETDGVIHWGPDKTLHRLPTGLPVPASLRNPLGATMGEPRVYVTPVADIDAVLLTIEDTGVAGQTIDIPGYGEIQI